MHVDTCLYPVHEESIGYTIILIGCFSSAPKPFTPPRHRIRIASSRITRHHLLDEWHLAGRRETYIVLRLRVFGWLIMAFMFTVPGQGTQSQHERNCGPALAIAVHGLKTGLCLQDTQGIITLQRGLSQYALGRPQLSNQEHSRRELQRLRCLRRIPEAGERHQSFHGCHPALRPLVLA